MFNGFIRYALIILALPCASYAKLGNELEIQKQYFSLNVEMSVDGKVISSPNAVIPIGDHGEYIITNHDKTYKVGLNLSEINPSKAKEIFGENIVFTSNDYLINSEVSMLDSFSSEERWLLISKSNIILELDKPASVTADALSVSQSASNKGVINEVSLRFTMHKASPVETKEASKCALAKRLSSSDLNEDGSISTQAASKCCTAGSVKCCWSASCCSDSTSGKGCCLGDN